MIKISIQFISLHLTTLTSIIKEIIKSGKKILCEKPVSINLEELLEIHKLILKTIFNFRGHRILFTPTDYRTNQSNQ